MNKFPIKYCKHFPPYLSGVDYFLKLEICVSGKYQWNAVNVNSNWNEGLIIGKITITEKRRSLSLQFSEKK